ncbi:hypothetical protein TorRG33x02_139330 [Trema orientale]|uniref:Uncharacterized protein n=1 Tax=Trema orientale TaxID=63057 RepID=A0A2P5EXM0_TREOI|nr:hypothetical protein TorRG33x02_139330 [Trema orientale]
MDNFGAYEWMDCVAKAEKDVLTIKEEVGSIINSLSSIRELESCRVADLLKEGVLLYYDDVYFGNANDDGRRFMVNDDSFETVSSKDEKVAGVEGIDSHVDIEKDIASNQFNKATDDGFSAKSDDDSQCNIDIGSSQSVSSNEKRVEKVLDAIGNNYRDSLYVWDAVKCKESTVVLNGWEILVATDLVIVRQFHLMSLKANEVVDSRLS